MLRGWAEFAAAFAVFFASHLAPTRPAVRKRLTAALGRGGFLAAYSLASIAVLAWLIAAAGRAPFVPVWPYAAWQRWAPNLAMPLVCLLIAFAVGASNPLTFGGARPERFDPERPGLARLTRHPILWALALWSLAHLVPNGDLAHLMMFGVFATLAFAGMTIIDRRKRREMGESEWRRLAEATSVLPLARGLVRPALSRATATRFAAAIALFLLLLTLHRPVIGVSPLIGGQ